MKPLVSVVMPVYNREAYLAESVNSVLNQTYKNIELVLVDDGSTDSSPKLIDYFAKKDKRVKVVTLFKNKGISFARNAGINASTGSYIAVHDSDDVSAPERIKKSVKAIQGADFVYSSYYMGDHNCKVAGITMPPVKVTLETLKKNSAWPHLSIMAKRECFIDNPYRVDFRVNDDAWLVYRFFVAEYKYKMVKEPLAIQRGHWGNTSRTKMKEIAKTQEIMNEAYVRLQENLDSFGV